MSTFRPLKALALSLIGVLAAGTAWSRDICWIESVTKTTSGVELRFFQSATALVFSSGAQTRELDVRPTLPSDAKAKTPPIVSSISAKPGDEIQLIGGAHDFCRLHVTTTNGKPGVLVYFSNTAPGMPHQTGYKFVAAQ